jgi:hypothetical protein
MKGTVVYIGHTGHVLAAVTRSSGTDTDLTVADLVPDELVTGINGFQVTYDPSDLGATPAELGPAELLEPTALRVALDPGGVKRQEVGPVIGTGNITTTYTKATDVLKISCQSVGTAKLGVDVRSAQDSASGLLVPASTAGRMQGSLSIVLGSNEPFLVLVDGFAPQAGKAPP